MSQDALGQLKHLKTARARWPFPDVSLGQKVYTYFYYSLTGITPNLATEDSMTSYRILFTRSHLHPATYCHFTDFSVTKFAHSHDLPGDSASSLRR